MLARPILAELLAAGAAKSVVGFEHLRGLIQAIGAAGSLVLSRALLDPDGRMRLFLGMKALADSAPDGRLPEIVSAFTRQRHAFELGLRGSLVLQEGLQTETEIPISRLYQPEGSPPVRLYTVNVGDAVRVLLPNVSLPRGESLDGEEALFLAEVGAVQHAAPTDAPPSPSISPTPHSHLPQPR